MTPLQKYQAILADIHTLLEARAARYFVTRYEDAESPDLKVQCDTITVLLKQYLEPHMMWFGEHAETQQMHEGVLVLDLDRETLQEEAHDAHD
jgi:hypothetical protein